VDVICGPVDFEAGALNVADDAIDVFVKFEFDGVSDEWFAVFRAEDEVVVKFGVGARHCAVPLANGCVAATRLSLQGRL
jgi:hypothetical protein